MENAPDWAPSGDRVAYVSTARGGAGLYTVDVASGTRAAIASGNGAEVEPAWSPDGGRIAFASDRDGPTHLYLLALATGEVRRLTDGPGGQGQPAWLPDGRIVFTAWAGGATALYWLDPASPADLHAIALPAGTPGHPAAAR
jgi:TolB protein